MNASEVLSVRGIYRDPLREDLIQNEALVDAYGPEEQALGWHHYLENKIHPFQAKYIVAIIRSYRRSSKEKLAKSGVWRLKKRARATCSC